MDDGARNLYWMIILWLLMQDAWSASPTDLAFVSHKVAARPFLGHHRQRVANSPPLPSSVVDAAFQDGNDGVLGFDLNINDNDDDDTDSSTLRSLTFFNLQKDEPPEPDVLCEFLLELGACSASLTDADAGTELERAIFAEPDANQAWQDSLHWASPVWNRCNVTAHFPASVDLTNVVQTVYDCFPEYNKNSNDEGGTPPVVEVVPNRDWVVHVQSSWKPIVVANKFVLTFPWHGHKDVDEQIELALRDIPTQKQQRRTDFIELQLQGGIAFGTGEHPTTQLCLEWLNDILPNVLSNDNNEKDQQDYVWLMDYGAGSGILGMAACRLAQQQQGGTTVLNAIGIDIDVDACQIANENAQLNNVNMRNYLPNYLPSDDMSKSLLLKAQQHAQTQLQAAGQPDDTEGTTESSIFMPESLQSQQFHVCVANILAGPLVALAPTLADLVQPGGYLGLSGILEHLGENVVQAYQATGFETVSVAKQQGGWVLVTGRKKHA